MQLVLLLLPPGLSISSNGGRTKSSRFHGCSTRAHALSLFCCLCLCPLLFRAAVLCVSVPLARPLPLCGADLTGRVPHSSLHGRLTSAAAQSDNGNKRAIATQLQADRQSTVRRAPASPDSEGVAVRASEQQMQEGGTRRQLDANTAALIERLTPLLHSVHLTSLLQSALQLAPDRLSPLPPVPHLTPVSPWRRS